jgi:hypothetical protein
MTLISMVLHHIVISSRQLHANHLLSMEAVSSMPLLGAGSGTGHRLATPSVRRPLETPMDRFV